MKKAHISTEVMYSIGVMVVIFLILTGISFNRNRELEKTSDFLKKKSECLKVSDTLSTMWLSGSEMEANITFKYTTSIFRVSGIIFVGETTETTTSVEATCTYNANIDEDYTGLLGKRTLKHREDVITITPA